MTDLRRTLTAPAVGALVVGGVIGSGIFIVPSAVLRQSGGAFGLALAVWAVAGFLVLLGALTYAELGAMQPGSGGLYLYLRDAFGRRVAFLYGWTLFFVIASGASAALAVASAAYLEQFAPLGSVGRTVVALLFLVVLAAINIFSTTFSVRLISVAMVVKVGVIALLVVIAPVFGDGFQSPERFWPTTWSVGTFVSAGAAMIAVLWSFEGWQFSTFVAGEVVDPQRNFPRGLGWGTAALVVIYLGANLAYFAALGGPTMAASERVASESVSVLLGEVPARLVALAIVLAMLSAAQMIQLTSARVFYAMGKDGGFIAELATVHPRFGTPAIAVGAIGIWAAILAVTGTFDQLLTYVVFVGWIFYALGAAAVLVFRHTRPTTARPFRVPGYPVTPVLFILAALTIVGNTILTQPKQAAVGLAAVALGLPVYEYWRRHTAAN